MMKTDLSYLQNGTIAVTKQIDAFFSVVYSIFWIAVRNRRCVFLQNSMPTKDNLFPDLACDQPIGRASVLLQHDVWNAGHLIYASQSHSVWTLRAGFHIHPNGNIKVMQECSVSLSFLIILNFFRLSFVIFVLEANTLPSSNLPFVPIKVIIHFGVINSFDVIPNKQWNQNLYSFKRF